MPSTPERTLPLASTSPIAADRRKLRESERRFRGAFEHASLGIILTTPDGTIAHVNEAFAHMLGYKPTELRGKTLEEITHPADRVYLVGEVRIRTASGTRAQERMLFQKRYLHRDGRIVWVRVDAAAIRDAQGQLDHMVAHVTDVTELREAQEESERVHTALAASEAMFRAVAEQAPVGVFLTDADGVGIYRNERLCTLCGLDADSFANNGWESVIHPDDRAEAVKHWREAFAAGRPASFEHRLLRPDGAVLWVTLNVSPLEGPDPKRRQWVGVMTDLTERRLGDERYRILFEGARDAIYTADLSGILTSANPAAEALTGYSRDELVGMNLLELIAPEQHAWVRETIDRAAAQGTAAPALELMLVRKDGSRRFAEVNGRVVPGNGHPARLEGIARDTTERHELEARLREQALHDDLTALANRTLFLDRLDQALGRSRRDGTPLAVMLLDVDDFKLVNDSLGHAAGDQVLVALARRLNEILRDGETVARLGGDEFGLVAERIEDEEAIAALAERVRSVFEAPFELGQDEQLLHGSLGIAVAGAGADGDETASDAQSLLRDADTAMYRAKAAGAGGYEFFDDGMREQLVRRFTLASALDSAIRNEQLTVHYQPIFSLADGRVLSVEALVRWSHPTLGEVDAGEFVAVAEQNGSIVPLGRQVIEQAAGEAARWKACFPGELPLGVFVNLSPRELSQEDFVPSVCATLQRHGLDGSELAFELTERVMIDDRDPRITGNLERLAARGIRLLLDDFGIGYSALSSLKRFPLAALKIDRYFVSSLTAGVEAPITRAIIGLGRTLELVVIAEGIECPDQLEKLRSLGCEAGQGFHLAMPQPASEIDELLAGSAATAVSQLEGGLPSQDELP